MPSAADSGEHLWDGDFICLAYDRNFEAGCGEGCRKVFDRDYAGDVYSCRRGVDVLLGRVAAAAGSGQYHHRRLPSARHGIWRQGDTVRDS